MSKLETLRRSPVTLALRSLLRQAGEEKMKLQIKESVPGHFYVSNLDNVMISGGMHIPDYVTGSRDSTGFVPSRELADQIVSALSQEGPLPDGLRQYVRPCYWRIPSAQALSGR